MSKKNTLFVMHELELGGAERVVSNLVNNLDRKKYILNFALFKKKGILVDKIKKDVKIYDLKASRVITSGHKLFALIVRLKPDIVFSSITHVNLLIGLFVPFIRLFNKNTKFITREVNIPSIRAKYMKKSKKLDMFYRHIIKNFDKVVAQSEYMSKDLQKSYGLDSSKIVVINNPLDVDMIDKALLNPDGEKVCFDKSRVNLLAVGNFRLQKGFDILLEVMPYLDEKFHLYIIGDGTERSKLEATIQKLNISSSVTLLGFKSNPYIYMKEADIFVLSSRYEGFPNVVLEANRCGKFVVAFEVAGVGEEIIQDGVNGTLVEFDNKRGFANAIKNYASTKIDEHRIIETTQKYRVENIIKEYEKLFEG